MTREDYVSLEVAKLLKEKGFDEPCLSQYTERGTIWNCQEPENFNATEGCYSRPTLYEAAKWFRIHHRISITPYYIGEDKYTYHLVRMDAEYNYCNNNKAYDTCEEALNEGILEALKLI